MDGKHESAKTPYGTQQGGMETMTPEKLAANRQNARHSTGPKSREGKARVSQNAIRHGLLARNPVLRSEDGEAFAAFRSRLLRTIGPVGDLEAFHADRAVALAWRLRRCADLEGGLFAWHEHEALAAYAHEEQVHDEADVMILAMTRIKHDPAAFAAARDVEAEARTQQARGWPALAHGFAADSTAFLILSRYETMLERGLYKALAELERLQQTRPVRPTGALPPAAVDGAADARTGA